VVNRPGLPGWAPQEDRVYLELDLLESVAPAAVARLPPVQSAVFARARDSPHLVRAEAEICAAGGKCPAKLAPGQQPERPQVSGSRK
jgi:hypothetical protein